MDRANDLEPGGRFRRRLQLATSTRIWSTRGFINHPFTGLPRRFAIDYKVDTAGPDGTKDVPAEAVIWDAKAERLGAGGGRNNAKSKVTFDYSKFLVTTWHHGQPITIADVIYPIAQGYEIAYDDDKVQIETASALRRVRCWRHSKVMSPATRRSMSMSTTGTSRRLYRFVCVPSAVSTPWEILAAMDDVVFEKRTGAYSDTAAARSAFRG